MHPAFADFVSDAEQLIADPHAIAARLAGLLEQDGWLAPEHQLPGTDRYRQHLLYVAPSRRLSVVALVAACAQVLHNGLAVLGVSAPARM